MNAPMIRFGSLGNFGGAGPAAATYTFPTTQQVTLAGTDKIAINDGANKYALTSAIAAYLGAATITGTVTVNPGGSGQVFEMASTPTGNGVNFAFLYNRVNYASGGAGNEAYSNDVVGWGTNIGDTIGVPGVAGKASVYHAIEQKFFNAEYGSEVHTQFIDAGGTNHRVDTGFYPHDGGTGSSRNIAVDVLNLTNFADTARIQFHQLNKIVELYDSVMIRGAVNNVPVMSQYNAALGAAINLPYVSSDNRIKSEAPIVVVGNTPTTGSYAHAFAVFQPVTLAGNVGATVLSLTGPGVTGAADAITAVGVCTTEWGITLFNQGTGAGAKAMLKLQTTASGGDPIVVYSGVDIWVNGLDRSAAEAFVWSRSDYLGAANRMVLETGGSLSAALPRSTTAALAAIGNAINTTFKIAGKVVINTTTGLLVTANGTTAAATWLALDGTTAHTPV